MPQATRLIEVPPRSECGSRAHGARLLALSAAVLLTASTLTGCASDRPKPTAQLVRASTLIGNAQQSQAQRYAAADLQRARDELHDARKAEADHKYGDARRLADRAAADADLASARAERAKSRQSADQVRRSLDTLRQQLQQQSPTPSADSGSGTDNPRQDHL